MLTLQIIMISFLLSLALLTVTAAIVIIVFYGKIMKISNSILKIIKSNE